MRFVPRAERTAWRAKAMDAAEHADLGSLIDLWLETRQIDRLVARIRTASAAEIEGLSHYQTEPVARRLAAPHPDVAAKVYRALGLTYPQREEAQVLRGCAGAPQERQTLLRARWRS
jgi:hypothetical protein